MWKELYFCDQPVAKTMPVPRSLCINVSFFELQCHVRVCVRLKIHLVFCAYSITRNDPNICVSPFHSVLPLHCRNTAEAMDKRRSGAPWANHSSRREDKRARDEFDHVAQDIVAKMKRELSLRLRDDADRLRRERNKVDAENDKLHAENDKLHAENDRLRTESDRKSAALSQLEQQLAKRFKTALEDAFEEVLGAPVVHEGATDPSEEEGAGPTLPEEEDMNNTNKAATGPGEAAPLPTEEDGGDKEGDKAQEDALEAAVRCRSDAPAA